MFLGPRALGALAIAGVVAAAIALFEMPLGLLLLDLIIVALIVLDVVTAPRASELNITRDHPDVLSIGGEGEVRLRLHNPTERKLGIELRDSNPVSLNRDPDRHLATLGPGDWRGFVAKITPTRRGWVPLGPITVRTFGPLRLAGRQSKFPSESRIKVYPALPSRKRVLMQLETRVLQSGEQSSAIRGGGTDFDSLREYHPDDEFKRINWMATARSVKPITNLYREEKNQQVIVLLDASRMMAASIDGISRFEYAIDTGIAISELSTRMGDQAGFIAFGARVLSQLPPRTGRDQPRRILDQVFDIRPRLEAPSYRTAFASALRGSRRRSLLVLLTELTDEAAMESLFEAMPALVSRHLVIVGAVLDPEIERVARSIPASGEGAYLKAGAAGAMSARQRAAARLTAMGAVVVDRTPHDLSGGVVDEYLRIKAFGRL